MVGALPLGDALKKRNISRRICFLHSRHRYFSCSIARMVWSCINLVWMSQSGVSLSSFSWVFTHMESNEPMPHFQLIFEFLRYWGLWFNWNMQNPFTFDSHVRVRKYVVKLKGLLLWQLKVLDKSRNLNHEERELCKVIYHRIRHLNWYRVALSLQLALNLTG